MRGQVVAAAEAAHADAALERLLTRVHAHVARHLVGAGEAAVAAFSGAGVWPLVRRRFALAASGKLPGSARFGELRVVGGARRLDLDLRGEGFDGGEWRERWRLLIHVYARLGIRMLRQKVVRQHRHQRGRLQAEAGRSSGGVGGRRTLLRREGQRGWLTVCGREERLGAG